jgi:Arc/MetJ family transcription regulator
MRTNIVLDDRLVKKAMTLAQVKTKKEIVNLALKEFVQTRERSANIIELFGSNCIDPAYDYKAARSGDAG